jgi:hypothetical protein
VPGFLLTSDGRVRILPFDKRIAFGPRAFSEPRRG